MRCGRLSFSADPALTKEALSPVWEAAPLSCSLVPFQVLHGSARKAVFVLVPTGDPPSLRFGHPDVTFGRYRLSSLGYCAGAAAFSEHVLRITARRLSQPRYWSVPVHTFLRSCRGTHPLGRSALSLLRCGEHPRGYPDVASGRYSYPAPVNAAPPVVSRWRNMRSASQTLHGVRRRTPSPIASPPGA